MKKIVVIELRVDNALTIEGYYLLKNSFQPQ